LLDRIRAERAKGRTSTPASQSRACRGPRLWDEIERDSPQWPEWEQASPAVLADFPGRRLPHTNVQRWHDLRVEQVQRERDARAEAAQAFAGRLAAGGVTHLGAAVKNAFSESAFRLAMEGADEQRIRDELYRLAHVVAAVDCGDLGRQRLELDRRKQELAERQELVARLLLQKDMNPRELNRFLNGLEDSPAFKSYFDAQSAFLEARRATEPPEEEHYCDLPDDEPEPEDDPLEPSARMKGYWDSREVRSRKPASPPAVPD
jgi:diadenosine tetraphosphatase ApaH/serine/threonine PP2A family protein phosphatase